ncbi:UNVERIFIED_CONTAM: hypothetical protein PYX00_008075 [Menopon gallinae]|uniref:Uncharacterized protein n=1 Tax=Menopon gallinae TaxID=328185 RepID=A0AAW2HLW7_9NEOP
MIRGVGGSFRFPVEFSVHCVGRLSFLRFRVSDLLTPTEAETAEKKRTWRYRNTFNQCLRNDRMLLGTLRDWETQDSVQCQQ